MILLFLVNVCSLKSTARRGTLLGNARGGCATIFVFRINIIIANNNGVMQRMCKLYFVYSPKYSGSNDLLKQCIIINK